MEEMFDYLRAVRPISPECLAFLRDKVRVLRLKKKEFLLRPGEVCKNMYFIKKGLLRCYYLFKGKEVTDWFFWENDTVVSVPSYYMQVPSEDFIQAREDCELYYISYTDLEHVYDKYPEFNFIGRVLTLKYLLVWHGLARNIKLRTAEERFDYLFERQPEVFNRVPIGDLATWLGMSPETLSRKRSEGASN